MKKLAGIGLILVVCFATSSAFPLSYEVDVGQDGTFETGGQVSFCGVFSRSVDIYVNDYSCAPNDTLFGVQLYIRTDPDATTVTNCTPNTAGGCDAGLSGCTEPEPGVNLFNCSNFSQIPVPDGKKLLGTFDLTPDGYGVYTLVVASDVGAPYDDGFLSDCNLASRFPDDGMIVVDQFGAPCDCNISPVFAVVNSQEAFQFTASSFDLCCQFPPAYIWSDNCTNGEVNQNGLFTADATCVGETCEVCVVDTANSDLFYTIEDCAEVEIVPLIPCYADCNDDKKVDLADLVIMKGEFLRTDCAMNPCQADCNDDNKVDLADLVIMKEQFLRTDCPACL